MRLRHTRHTGFTIVELLIVIVVIGILATIVIIAYNGVQDKATRALLEADLSQANKQLGVYRVDNSETYPTDLSEANNNTGLKFTDRATLMYTAYNEQDPPTYCLTAIIGSLAYYITRGKPPTEGYCPDHQLPGAPEVPAINTMSDSSSQITVSWEAVEGADSYTLERAPTETFADVTETSGLTGTSEVVTGLDPETTYYFRLYAVNDVGPSSASEIVSETTQAAPVAGAPVVSCTVNSPSQVTISWSAVSGADTYQLERSTSSSFTSPTLTTGITGTSQVVTGLSAGARYYFRGYAVNSANVVGPAGSAINCVTTISAPDSPSVSVSIPGSARSASSGPWAKSYDGLPTSGNWYYASGSVSSSTCASGTTRQQRARIQYNSPTTWGAWTGWTTSSTFYAVGPSSGYGIRFQVQTRCYTSYYTSSGSSYGYGCRWRSTNSTSCSGF